MKKVQVIPQESWLAKSRPNLEELLATIPLDTLVSKKEELESQQEFKDIMSEVNNVKPLVSEGVKVIYKCKNCKFNSTSTTSLKTHNKTIHDHVVLKCDKCPVCTLSEAVLKKHIDSAHKASIKKTLNFIKGGAGGLSDSKSNPNRGQALNSSKTVLDKESKSIEKQPIRGGGLKQLDQTIFSHN